MNYASIRELDISNGKGVGVALFVQGCKFHCYNCFNQNTWDCSKGNKWTSETEEKFLELANRPYINRISILGGSPLIEENLDGILQLINKIRLSMPNKTIWLWTGFTWEYIFNDLTVDVENNSKRREIIRKCDILVDGQYVDSKRDITLKWRGSSNQRVINVQESLRQNKIILYVDEESTCQNT